MEALYRKLHDKYTTLKKRGFSELDEIGKDQELKFLEYVSAAEDVIQHLQDERDRLSAEVGTLRDEVALIRSTKDEQCAEYQKLLMEEKQKNNMLSKEIESVQKLLQERPCSSVDGLNDKIQWTSAQFNIAELSGSSMRRMTRKRSREARAEMERNAIAYESSNHEDLLVRESAAESSKATASSGDLSIDQLPECCKTRVDQSGGGVINDKSTANCYFQALIEYLVGMKLSNINQSEGTCISALHQSSGYSFSLTWVKKASGEEPELLYRVLTLGTFETVAPEWMRSVMMFSMSMCPIFFERVSRVIKLHR